MTALLLDAQVDQSDEFHVTALDLFIHFPPPVISLEDVGLKIVRVYNPNSSTLATLCEELTHWKRL